MVDLKALEIIKSGSIKVRVKRTGMIQLVTFNVKRVQLGSEMFAELYFPRVIDRSEIQRVANDIGLPVEAEGVRAMPKGMTAKDFVNL